jgi:hypothetical protein
MKYVKENLNEGRKHNNWYYKPSALSISKANREKKIFLKTHPDAKITISGRDGFVRVNGRIAYDISAMIGNRTPKDVQGELQDAYDKSKATHESLNEGFATAESENVDRIASMLGYDDFAEFLGDNPGCYEVILEWIDRIFAKQIAEEGMDEPEALEKMGLYQAADLTREAMGDEDDEDDYDPR